LALTPSSTSTLSSGGPFGSGKLVLAPTLPVKTLTLVANLVDSELKATKSFSANLATVTVAVQVA
jgi:hypothetical protein